MVVAVAGCIMVGCTTARPQADIVYFPPPPASARVVHLKSFSSLDQIVERQASFLDALRGAPIGPSVFVPCGIHVHGSTLYICDTALNVVHVWNLETGESRRLGARGAIQLRKPVDVVVAEDGTTYVADTGRGEVAAFSTSGTGQLTFKPDDSESFRPVAVALRGDELFAADVAGHRVEVFDRHDATHLRSIGDSGDSEHALRMPTGVALTTSELFVSNFLRGEIIVFDQAGNVSRTIGQLGDRYGDLGKPRHLALGPMNALFIADPEFAHVHIFDTSGALLMLLGGPEDQPGGTPVPVGIAVTQRLPESVEQLVPADFRADYFVFVASSMGRNRIALFAVGERATAANTP